MGRLAKRLEAESSKLSTVAGLLAPSDYDSILEELFDYCEANPSVKRVMVSEFDDRRPYTRDDLNDLYARLRAGGLQVRCISTVTAFFS